MPVDFLIHDAVSRHAREAPQRAALRFGGEALSYADLDAESDRLARALVDAGLEKGDRVGLFLRKSLELGVGIYGALKAGGVFVPLDPSMPAERLEFILRDCGITHVVSADDRAAVLGELDASLGLVLFGVSAKTPFEAVAWERIRALPAERPDVWVVDQDLGYLMYTSGSTGAPKGMMHTHHGSLSYARWGAQHVGLTPEDRVASHAPLHFDLSIFDFFSTAQAGATVVLVPEPVTKFPASWTELVEEERVSVVFTVPFTLIEMLERGALAERDLSSLRWILFGGEPFPPKHLRALMAALPGARFTNVYGPAEAPSCTCYDLPPVGEPFAEPVPIGTVSVNSQELILDEEDRECAPGEAGELCIRSSTLTRGYWNRPDLNERAFFRRAGHGPFPDVFYRTGDVVLRGEDGLLRFLGRRDRMVKTRGHRVELDEVEAAIASHPGVLETAAYVVPDAQGSRDVCAAVTLREPGTVGAPDLLAHARGKLPVYAVPRHLAIVPELPHTSGGKIDRKRLAEAPPHLAGS